MPQRSQCVLTPVITLCWALVVDSTPPWENMGHSWHFSLKARSSDTMMNSLPAISTVVCRGTQSCPKQEPSLIRADHSKILPTRILQRGSYWPPRMSPETSTWSLVGSSAKSPKDTKQSGTTHENRRYFCLEVQWKVALLLIPYNPACTSHHKWTWQSLPGIPSNLALTWPLEQRNSGPFQNYPPDTRPKYLAEQSWDPPSFSFRHPLWDLKWVLSSLHFSSPLRTMALSHLKREL